ncbi:MAG: MarR family winged helix-turn-helix transcriptional regulator [Bdellovibrionia bacterium]
MTKKLRKPQINPESKKPTSPTKSQLGEVDSYLGYWLRFVSNQVTASFQQRLATQGVSVAEWIALRVLCNLAPCSSTRLVQEMGMDKGVVSRLTDRLEKQGLIKREVSPVDRRFFSIELTPQGCNLIPALTKIADENDAFFFGHLSKTESATLINTLKDLVSRHGFKAKPVD